MSHICCVPTNCLFFYTRAVDGPFPGEAMILRGAAAAAATTAAAPASAPAPALAAAVPLLLRSSLPGHPEHPHHALVAGAVGGYFVWGRYSSVNNQVVLYLASRVLVGLWKRHCEPHVLHQNLPLALRERSYAITAAAVWGLVMLLFEESPDVLHPSLTSSMNEIYRFRQSSMPVVGTDSSSTGSAPTSAPSAR